MAQLLVTVSRPTTTAIDLGDRVDGPGLLAALQTFVAGQDGADWSTLYVEIDATTPAAPTAPVAPAPATFDPEVAPEVAPTY